MTFEIQTWVTSAAYVSGGIAMGFGAIGAAIGEGYTAAKANEVMTRNPAVVGDIFKTMLVGQAVAESASIFSLVVAVLLLFNTATPSLLTAAAMLGAGLSMGFGALGPGVGCGFPSATACEGIARQPETAQKVTTTMLVGQAVAQSTAIYALVISLILLYKPAVENPTIASGAALIGAGLCMGLGAIGPGIGEGITASTAVTGVARNQEYTALLTRTMMVGMAVAESTGIYSLVIALLLIFVVK
ncbi:MAG: ATP synthase F0 subunit C [Desulfococcaceae bacterium]